MFADCDSRSAEAAVRIELSTPIAGPPGTAEAAGDGTPPGGGPSEHCTVFRFTSPITRAVWSRSKAPSTEASAEPNSSSGSPTCILKSTCTCFGGRRHMDTWFAPVLRLFPVEPAPIDVGSGPSDPRDGGGIWLVNISCRSVSCTSSEQYSVGVLQVYCRGGVDRR